MIYKRKCQRCGRIYYYIGVISQFLMLAPITSTGLPHNSRKFCPDCEVAVDDRLNKINAEKQKEKAQKWDEEHFAIEARS